MRTLKKLLRILPVMMLVLFLLTFVFFNFVDFSFSEKQVQKKFADRHEHPESRSYWFGERMMHYVSIGADSLPMIVFVHGSPGAWDNFIHYFEDSSLYHHAKLVAVDRLGFGKTGGKAEPSLEMQARSIEPLLDLNKNKQLPVLVGHSYGGPVIAKMAMDYPEKTGGLIFVAGSIDPELEKVHWYNELADWWLVKWMLPSMWRNSNEEIMPLKDELNKMLGEWKEITVPVTVIQGMEDKLVPPANADFAANRLTHCYYLCIRREEHVNHLIPWMKPELITRAIKEHLYFLN